MIFGNLLILGMQVILQVIPVEGSLCMFLYLVNFLIVKQFH
jgi:hypothetical protein